MANTKDYRDSQKAFLAAVDKALEKIENSLTMSSVTEKTFDGNILNLENNTIHVYNGKNGVRELTIIYPKGNFISTVLFSTCPTGNINIHFPEGRTKFVGSAPYEFFPAENWELNIHNGRVVGSQLF